MQIFNILDLIISIEDNALPIRNSLEPFLTTYSSGQKSDIQIRLLDEPIRKIAEKLASESIRRSELGDGYLFTYSNGQFGVNNRFSNVQLWSPKDRAVSLRRDGFVNFNGDPGMRLILWGRAAIESLCYIHGALNVIAGKYIIFLGDSGVGKTTLSNFACDLGGTCLTEENPFIALKGEMPMAYGTPWPGPKGPDVPKSGKLAALFFLRHAEENNIQRLDHATASRRLLHNTRIFKWLPEEVPKAIEVLDKVARLVPAYDFGFLPNHSAIEAIRKVL